ncbi:Gfo/Idh/MocA family oxidoreductase [Hymenobacter aquaticus]|uniref:Gfo/Idh/MocA family oxidoreductase n=1 Tax=Hymenobacter aquaticus TaxID=1867101 RepID=A0A4Z0Q6L8_9BACT|nr:Gfo/Idh/MocA family oxidoreductase [Hymenobacter aquaticus]TGE25728.1 Gfo/Idh/MocA family oxidoreductase [Hymenobacter aquaticus]
MNNFQPQPALPLAGDPSRRNFIAQTGRGLLAVGVAGTLGGLPAASAAAATDQASDLVLQSGPTDVTLPEINARTEPRSSGVPNPQPVDQRVGYAVVGLGHLTLEELLPALAQCKKSKLVALVSGDADKMGKVARQYGIAPQNCYSYQTYDNLKDNPAVEVIYIVLPNSMHAEYTIRGARAGKHILCEKPMANSVKECEQMIEACQKAGKKLMIAYRIQYEPMNRKVQEMVRGNAFGKTKIIEATNTQNQGPPDQWRHKKALAGGGALPDIGLYCLNTVRFLLGEEPTEVAAHQYTTPGDPRFTEVEENMLFTLRFPSGVLANCVTGYGSYTSKRYRVQAETGWIQMDPAFSYHGLRLERAHAPEGTQQREQVGIAEKNQFALEMDHFSDCVRHNQTPYTPGEEGLQDQRIMEALYQSARSGGKPVKLKSDTNKLDAFRGTPPTEHQS